MARWSRLAMMKSWTAWKVEFIAASSWSQVAQSRLAAGRIWGVAISGVVGADMRPPFLLNQNVCGNPDQGGQAPFTLRPCAAKGKARATAKAFTAKVAKGRKGRQGKG